MDQNIFMNNNPSPQDIFGMMNNIFGQSGLGNMFNNGQFSGFDQNFNNIFSQFGNMGQQRQGFNVYSTSTNSNNEQNNQEQEEENSEEEDEETEEELQRRYIELRNSIINQLPRYKFNYYKKINKEKEIQEYFIILFINLFINLFYLKYLCDLLGEF